MALKLSLHSVKLKKLFLCICRNLPLHLKTSMKLFSFCLVIFFAFTIRAQTFERDFPLAENATIKITNFYGRVHLIAREIEKSEDTEKTEKDNKIFLVSENIKESDLKIVSDAKRFEIVAAPTNQNARIDLSLKIPAGIKVEVETRDGEVRLEGRIESAEIKTETGTIAANVSLDDLRYDFVWTESRPRFLSDVELKEADEKAGGKFVIHGKLGEKDKSKKAKEKNENDAENPNAAEETEEEKTNNEQSVADKKRKSKTKDQKPQTINLNFTTARGIILLNVNPNEVPSDLRERPLTEAAKAIVRSGDSLLTEAIRRASPKYFGVYAKTLPPRKTFPTLSESKNAQNNTSSPIKQVIARVTDLNNRAIADLKPEDFEVSESNENREILSVEKTTAPFNLVLLLDVSGSVDNYVDFIRKAARNFVNTVSPKDKIAIIIFNEDVKNLSTFTTDKGKLSESLDTFDAGGGTAFYDALAYTLAETLRPLKGERTAIVVLSDGDDNRSFLAFDSLLGSIQESGALIYPLFVPSGLIAASATNDANSSVDPLRSRYIGLTTKAESEGAKLAEVSGGVYYSITALSQLQKAYDDIVLQLRTAYSITFRSNDSESKDNRASPRLKVRVKRENSFVKLGSVIGFAPKEASEIQNKEKYLPFPASFASLSDVVFQNASFTTFHNKKQTSAISGEIEKINYKQIVGDNLREYKFENLDVNKTTGAFLLTEGEERHAVSRWISPKRTRSYPYERVYDTLAYAGKKVAIIPVVKDEGLGGERDFLQWDTISLLSLLDVHVVLAYYNEATKNAKRADQITGQKFDNDYIASRLKEIFDFKGTARDWNELETKRLKGTFEKAKFAYAEISKTTKTYLHDETALNQLIKLAENSNDFAQFSRNKSQRGQSRELESIQPKEALATDTKGGVTITNLAGGKYYLTCDETRVENKTLYLIEDKHSSRTILPSENDIKDGLLKMMLYTNLKNVRVGKNPVDEKAVLRLTSSKLVGSINSASSEEESAKFCEINKLEIAKRNLIGKLFDEARANKFTIILEHAETAK